MKILHMNFIYDHPCRCDQPVVPLIPRAVQTPESLGAFKSTLTMPVLITCPKQDVRDKIRIHEDVLKKKLPISAVDP
jgi:hypothetical protein